MLFRSNLLSLSVAFALLGSASVSAYADDKTDDKPAATASKSRPAAQPAAAYLGIGVAPLPEGLASQLPQVLKDGRGVLVLDVMSDSPAAKAGLKPHDILVTYDNQKLFSPEQLVKLIHGDQIGKAVVIEFVRAGAAEAVKVTLGQQPASLSASASGTGERAAPRWFERGQEPLTPDERAERWRTFDSMSLTKLDEHRFKAEVRFRDDQGKVETRAYEGTHDEIRAAIKAEQHLPGRERRHLLRALDMPDHPFEFPGFRVVPPSGGVHWDYEEFRR